ncbi:hypothetical protein FB446DRAFT_117410 [Lentinula raphanica]|nr:hypothetical protein FB446DRAFT_117410 [Lentinula raphanica]
MLLPSISPLFSARRTFPFLSLAMCLLGIPVISRPVYQDTRGTMALQASNAESFQLGNGTTALPENSGKFCLEVALQQYSVSKEAKQLFRKTETLVSLREEARKSVNLRAGSRRINRNPMRISKYWEKRETKFGHFYFEDEKQAQEAFVRAQRNATESQILPVPGDDGNWKFTNDVILYLIDNYNAVATNTANNWIKIRPYLNVTVDQSNELAFIFYRSDAKDPRPNGKLSVRIGYEWLISPKRTVEETIDFKNATFVPIGRIKEGVKIDFDALREHAAKHTELLGDKPGMKSKWLSEFKEKKREIEEFQGLSMTKARAGYFDEWVFEDGIVDGLLKQNAIDMFLGSKWIEERDHHLAHYLAIVYSWHCRNKRNSEKRRQKNAANPPKKAQRIDKRGSAIEPQPSSSTSIETKSTCPDDHE